MALDGVEGMQNQSDALINNPIDSKDRIVEKRDALTIDGLEDEVFIKVARELIDKSKLHFETTYSLSKRRKENEKYLFGRQLDGVKLKPYSVPFIDNILFESMLYKKAMMMSRPPEIVVKAGQDTDQSKEEAKQITKVVNSDIQSRERKRVLIQASLHRPVYLIGVIKTFWNPQKGKNGDYDFKVVHPDNIVVDYRSASNDAADMDFIAESVEYTVKEWVMRFPTKEKEFYDELRKTGDFDANKNENSEAGMNSKVKGWEIWFTWYDRKEDKSFERIEGVGWFYNKLVLGKMKDPNWDWEGQPQTFKYDKPVSEQDLASAIASANMSGLATDTVFHNHFENPTKPYIFLGYTQWGKTPIDETSELEQSIGLQQNYDKRGKQITEMLDRARGKHIFSSAEGLKAEDIEEMDPSDPDESMIVKGDVGKVHAFIPGEVLTPSVVENFNDLRERIFDKMGVHGPARGEIDASAPATNNQISREGDFSRSDDMVDDTINYAAEKMANWILQFIKLRYTEDHFKRILGDDGGTTFQRINRDMIQDGMEVTITASGTDKLKAEQSAMDMAKLKLTDPYSFFVDTNKNDPMGRTEKLMTFLTAPDLYLQKLKGQGSGAGLAGGLAAASGGSSPQAQMDIQQLSQGQIPQVPSVMDPAYISTFTAWAQSPALDQVLQQFPQQREQILSFIQQVIAMGKQQAGNQNAAPAQPPAIGGPQPQAAAAGPLTGNPTPQNTSKVAAVPSPPSAV